MSFQVCGFGSDLGESVTGIRVPDRGASRSDELEWDILSFRQFVVAGPLRGVEIGTWGTNRGPRAYCLMSGWLHSGLEVEITESNHKIASGEVLRAS